MNLNQSRPPMLRLDRVRLVTSAREVDTSTLHAEFPTIAIERSHAACVDDAVIDADRWRTATRFGEFDVAFTRSACSAIMVRGDRSVERVACEALTRYQRFILRGNSSSRTSEFVAVLTAHRRLYDVSKPLARADLDHALDTWQWMLRLEPKASLAAQLAALFHDIERLESEADARVEHRSNDYQAFKDAHAMRCGAWTFDILRSPDVSVDERVATRVREIVTLHERRGVDAEIDLLNDADALSFLSLSSSSYLDYFGPAQTHRQLVHTLARLGDLARTKLSLVRLRPDVRSLFQVAA